MSEINLGSPSAGNIQPQDPSSVEKPVKNKVDAKPSPVTSAVAKGGKEEPKNLGERILSKLQDIFGSKIESTANTPSLKFSQKVLGMLVPGKKNLSERTSSIVKQSLSETGTASKDKSGEFSELSNMLAGKTQEGMTSDVDNTFPTDLPPTLPKEHDDNTFPKDLPPTLPQEARVRPKPLPKRPEKHDDAAPPTFSQESIARIRPGQNPAIGLKHAENAKKTEAALAQVESRNKQLGFLMAEFPAGEKTASKSMGEVPKLLDSLMSDSIDKPLLQTMPRLTKRLNDYKENYKNAEGASKKFDQKLEAIIQNNSLDPLAKCAELGKLYTSDFKEYANALSPCITNYKGFLEDTQGFGARPVANDSITTKVSVRLNDSGAAPMQRIMRHGLLLGEMVKSMPKDDPRQADLQKVLNEVLEVTKVVNAQQKK